jgi:hypothetical protein
MLGSDALERSLVWFGDQTNIEVPARSVSEAKVRSLLLAEFQEVRRPITRNDHAHEEPGLMREEKFRRSRRVRGIQRSAIVVCAWGQR